MGRCGLRYSWLGRGYVVILLTARGWTPVRMTTEEKKARRRELARLRYANNPETRQRYQEKARARIPVKCEHEKEKRRRIAAEEGRLLGQKRTIQEQVESAIIEEYEAERRVIARMEKAWRKHPEKLRMSFALASRRQWATRKNEPGFRQRKALRTRLWKFVTGTKKQRMSKLIGCTREQFVEYIQKRFTKGMHWNNYGEWEMDHIIPCTAFDLTDPEQQRKCFHYTNLQPMWKRDNIRKGNKIKTHQPELVLHLS